MTVVGTRPELIRLSRVLARLDEHVEHVLVHTGQNYDYELNEIFFKDLRLRKPDYFLGIETASLGQAIAGIIRGTEEMLVREKPDALLILGDTNSALASIMARRMQVPIYHMEAGNRCFDFNVPEETNRRIVDHVSDFNLVYTEHARRNLLREGLPARRIYLTGSPMGEVLAHYREDIRKSTILRRLKLVNQKYFVVSAHREENVDTARNLRSIVSVLNALAEEYRLPVVVSTHPRTQKRLDALKGVRRHQRIAFMKPFGFHDYVHLQMHARCTLSDSGTISEEAAILSFPAVTIRNAMERPEAMDAGNIVMTGLEPAPVLEAVRLLTADRGALGRARPPFEYEIQNTSDRVLKIIMGTARLSHRWDGIEPRDPAPRPRSGVRSRKTRPAR